MTNLSRVFSNHFICHLLRKVLVTILFLYLFDLILGVHLFNLILIDRKILFLVLCVTYGFFVYLNPGKFGLSFNLKVILLFLVFNIFWFFLGPLTYGASWSYAYLDSRGFLVLLATVVLIITQLQIKDLLIKIKKTVVILNMILMVSMIIFYLIGNYLILQYGTYAKLNFFIESFIYPTTYIGLMPDGFFRVLWVSALWMILGIFWCIDVIANKYGRLIYYLIAAVALLVSYTRGFWIGIGLGILTFAVLDFFVSNKGEKMASFDRFAILIIPLTWTLVASCNNRIYDRFVGVSSVSSDESYNVRVMSIKALLNYWQKAPIFGHGYGAFVPDFIRDAKVPFSYEAVPFALLMKLGIVGFCFFYGFFLYLIFTSLKFKKNEQMPNFVAAMVSFLIITSTNPYLFNLVGMTVLGLLLVAWITIVDER